MISKAWITLVHSFINNHGGSQSVDSVSGSKYNHCFLFSEKTIKIRDNSRCVKRVTKWYEVSPWIIDIWVFTISTQHKLLSLTCENVWLGYLPSCSLSLLSRASTDLTANLFISLPVQKYRNCIYFHFSIIYPHPLISLFPFLPDYKPTSFTGPKWFQYTGSLSYSHTQ